MKDDTKRINDRSILDDSDATSRNSSADNWTNTSNETNNINITGKEIINEQESIGENVEPTTYAETRAIRTLPGGCNIYYGQYVDNYSGNVRTRYYVTQYNELVASTRVTSTTIPTGAVCITELPDSYNTDMGIIWGTIGAAMAIWLAVKFVVGRIIR